MNSIFRHLIYALSLFLIFVFLVFVAFIPTFYTTLFLLKLVGFHSNENVNLEVTVAIALLEASAIGIYSTVKLNRTPRFVRNRSNPKFLLIILSVFTLGIFTMLMNYFSH